MPDLTIHLNKNRQQVTKVVNELPDLLASGSGAGGLIQSLLSRLGTAVLQQIHKAFLVKSQGGTDVAGLRWKPLSPYTIAMRERTKRRLSSALEAKMKKERQRWWQVYRTARKSMGESSASSYAWMVARREGLATLQSGRGAEQALILIETGDLVESLKPASRPEQASSFVGPRKDQVFRLGKGEVTIGTRRPFAALQHTGDPGRKPPLPQRRLWPEVAQWPSSWWKPIMDQARDGVQNIILHILRR